MHFMKAVDTCCRQRGYEILSPGLTSPCINIASDNNQPLYSRDLPSGLFDVVRQAMPMFTLLILTPVSSHSSLQPMMVSVRPLGLVNSCLRPLSLPPSSRVAWRCPPSFRPFGGAEAEAPLG
jgi:hypothetical protein